MILTSLSILTGAPCRNNSAGSSSHYWLIAECCGAQNRENFQCCSFEWHNLGVGVRVTYRGHSNFQAHARQPSTASAILIHISSSWIWSHSLLRFLSGWLWNLRALMWVNFCQKLLKSRRDVAAIHVCTIFSPWAVHSHLVQPWPLGQQRNTNYHFTKAHEKNELQVLPSAVPKVQKKDQSFLLQIHELIRLSKIWSRQSPWIHLGSACLLSYCLL